MSTISVSDLKKKPAKQWLKAAGQEDLVITSKGQPIAVLIRIAAASVESTRADRPEQFQAGLAHFGDPQFGDYSATTLDPTDGLSFWTVQGFAKDGEVEPFDTWDTWVTKLRLRP